MVLNFFVISIQVYPNPGSNNSYSSSGGTASSIDGPTNMIFNSGAKFDESEQGFAQKSAANIETDTEMVSSEWELFSSGSLRKVVLHSLNVYTQIFG